MVKALNTIFDVTVLREEATGGWIAFNNQLPFAVEAESFELLVQRAWEIAPEMLALNHSFPLNKNCKLRFMLESERALPLVG